ncbi:MAG: hypothetical protein QOI81_253 [Actinomycetota bacterium]|jgi:hypothetical protein|nr:hypothetical protein [Actinomycetota bacterium]
MAESAKKKAGHSKVSAVPDMGGEGSGASEASTHQAAGCPVALCPICAAVTLLQPVNPEVVEHLLNAGREFILAAKAALESVSTERTAVVDDGSLEKIDIG